MKSRMSLLLAAVGIAVGLCLSTGGFPARVSWPSGARADETASAETTKKLPPLKVDKSAPLLLLDEPTGKPPDTSHEAINESCFVCHGNFKEEPLVVTHAKEEVGCTDCHGDSMDHADDEDNITPPDVMFMLETIDEACQECHDTHDVAAKDVLARWQKRCPEKTDFKTVVCTDCHFRHHLEKRVVQWNKKTRELIVRPTGEAAQ